MASWKLRLLDTIEEMKSVEELQLTVWPGNPIFVTPDHFLVALAHNGHPIIGAFETDDGGQEVRLIGVAIGFLGFVDTPEGRQQIYYSHQMGVHPDYQSQGIGFALKRAQWQMARQQGYERITWTYDPLLSRNAHLNIAKLGALCNTYKREVYGEMRDKINAGAPTDRFQVDWWLNTPRVENRLGGQPASRLTLQQYLDGGAEIINPGICTPKGELSPPNSANIPDAPSALLLAEIPSDMQALKKSSPDLALAWRLQTRQIFEELFSTGYLVTDFLYLPGKQPHSYYVLSYDESPH